MYGGDGLARLDGRVVFAPFVLPGERIRADGGAGKAAAWCARARWKCWSPRRDRVAAPCPYFARCGGCHYQHAPYDYQLRPSAPSWRRSCGGWARSSRRRRSRWSRRALGLSQPRRSCTWKTGRIGYREARSHKLCAIEQLPDLARRR